MSDLEVVELNKGDPRLDEVERCFLKLHEFMKDTGLMIPLVEKGETVWRRIVEKTIGGKFGQLLAAVLDDKIIGFAYGTLKFTPDYTGNLRIGYIPYVYVDPETRVKGVGRELVAGLEKWFDGKEVHSYELQVLCGNESGVQFWEKIGYQKELYQMRKFTKISKVK